MKYAWLFLLAGCQEDITTMFPPGLEPFSDDGNAAALVHDGNEGLVTRAIDFDMIRVYGRGYLYAPFAAVWTAAHEPRAWIGACNTTTQTVTPDNDPGYELSFLVHYFVDDILNVEWDDQWRGAEIEAGLAMLKHQKIFGSDIITISEGTTQLVETDDPNITELLFVEHLDAAGGSKGDVVGAMQHQFDSLRSLVNGGTIPPCLIPSLGE